MKPRRTLLRIAAHLRALLLMLLAPTIATAGEGEERVTAQRPFRTVVAVELNPLALLAGRVSSTFEVMPARHHALVVTPYFRRGDANPVGIGQGSFAHAWTVAYATELGYRAYSGRDGLNGFYIGPSVVIGSQWNAHGTEGDRYGRSLVFGFVGDLGGQVSLGDFIIGGGAGIGFTSEKFCESPCFAFLFGRVLFSVGWVLAG